MGLLLPVLIPGTTNPSILFINHQIDISQSLRYPDPTVNARITGSNDDDFKRSKILDGYVSQLEGRLCSVVRNTIDMEAWRVSRQIRDGRHRKRNDGEAEFKDGYPIP
jgi:hypothetical protein